VPWVVVLKIVGDVDFTGHPLDQDYMHNPEDWNYWQREALAFESGLLGKWPGPMRPVRTLGVEHVDDSHAWIWLGAVEEPCRVHRGRDWTSSTPPTTSAVSPPSGHWRPPALTNIRGSPSAGRAAGCGPPER
jgi:hypothetical protein